MADKPRMPYVTSLVHEVQRYASILNIMRMSTADQTIGGQFIPSGTYIAFCFGAVLHHDPIFESPSEFMPERFLHDDGKTFRK
ncbi:cytochrome P450 2N1, partial [Aphelenchoides avenae]